MIYIINGYHSLLSTGVQHTYQDTQSQYIVMLVWATARNMTVSVWGGHSCSFVGTGHRVTIVIMVGHSSNGIQQVPQGIPWASEISVYKLIKEGWNRKGLLCVHTHMHMHMCACTQSHTHPLTSSGQCPHSFPSSGKMPSIVQTL